MTQSGVFSNTTLLAMRCLALPCGIGFMEYRTYQYHMVDGQTTQISNIRILNIKEHDHILEIQDDVILQM